MLSMNSPSPAKKSQYRSVLAYRDAQEQQHHDQRSGVLRMQLERVLTAILREQRRARHRVTHRGAGLLRNRDAQDLRDRHGERRGILVAPPALHPPRRFGM
jgi:hypothetical protein